MNTNDIIHPLALAWGKNSFLWRCFAIAVMTVIQFNVLPYHKLSYLTYQFISELQVCMIFEAIYLYRRHKGCRADYVGQFIYHAYLRVWWFIFGVATSTLLTIYLGAIAVHMLILTVSLGLVLAYMFNRRYPVTQTINLAGVLMMLLALIKPLLKAWFIF